MGEEKAAGRAPDAPTKRSRAAPRNRIRLPHQWESPALALVAGERGSHERSPGAHLAAILRRYPDLPHHVDSFRAGRGHDPPDWPCLVFRALAAWHAVAMQEATPADLPRRAGDIATLGALAPGATHRASINLMMPCWTRWPPRRWTTSCRRKSSCACPSGASTLHCRPNASPSLGSRCTDFCIPRVGRGRRKSRQAGIAPAAGQRPRPRARPLHLGMWTVQEALRRAAAEAQRVAAQHGLDAPPGVDAYARDMADAVTPLLSLLLYLCADAPEVDSAREPGASPATQSRATASSRACASTRPTSPRSGG